MATPAASVRRAGGPRKQCRNMPRNMLRTIVLASSSRYRQEQLARLRLPFGTAVPGVDEAPLAGETHASTAQRLALLKARACAPRHTDALIIGADQVAELDGAAIGKPGTHAAATAQLHAMAGRAVRFHSGLALLDARSGQAQSGCVTTEVRFRALTDAAIEAYLRADQPYDCAGSAKIESLAPGGRSAGDDSALTLICAAGAEAAPTPDATRA